MASKRHQPVTWRQSIGLSKSLLYYPFYPAGDLASIQWPLKVAVVLPILPVWWEHLPIEVVVQMLGGRFRNRGGVLVLRPFKSVDQGQPVSETFEVSQCQSLRYNQLTHRPGG